MRLRAACVSLDGTGMRRGKMGSIKFIWLTTAQGAVTPPQQAGAANPGLLAEVDHPRQGEGPQTRSTDVKAVAKEIKTQSADPHPTPPKRVCFKFEKDLREENRVWEQLVRRSQSSGIKPWGIFLTQLAQSHSTPRDVLGINWQYILLCVGLCGHAANYNAKFILCLIDVVHMLRLIAL